MKHDEQWIDGPPELAQYDREPVGVLLDVDIPDNGREMTLVGHINESRGVCNDCTCDFSPDDVIRHRFVWREGDAK